MEEVVQISLTRSRMCSLRPPSSRPYLQNYTPEWETGRRMKLITWLIATMVFLLSSCSGDRARTYEDLAEVRQTNDYSVLSEIAVPADARKISVNFDAETSYYYVSYITSTARHSIKALGLSPISGPALESARQSIGFGVTLPDDAAVYAGCVDRWRHPPAGEPVEKEVLFLANAGGRQHQWNELYRTQSIRQICGSE